MELGQKLKQARLDAGLSQRQLCGDTITRNMLSQIENGSAKPSFSTLQALCARLGKPVSYFWDDGFSDNLKLLNQAVSAPTEQAFSLLQHYLSPDPLLDDWYSLLLARCYMDQAEQALSENRTGYAQSLLAQAEECGKKAPDFENYFSRRFAILSFQAKLTDATVLVKKLPDNTEEMLLRAKAALDTGDTEKSLAYLTAADRQTESVLFLLGDTLMQNKDYEKAVKCFSSLEATQPKAVYSRLEICYRELGDFQKAYEYACKQR